MSKRHYLTQPLRSRRDYGEEETAKKSEKKTSLDYDKIGRDDLLKLVRGKESQRR